MSADEPTDTVYAEVEDHDLSHHSDWIVFNQGAKQGLSVLLAAFLLVMSFQSWELWQERRARNQSRQIVANQSQALKDLGLQEKEDQKFFDLVGQLIVLGQNQSPEAKAEREAILQQLNDLRIQHERDAAAARAKQGASNASPPATSSKASTTTTAGSHGPSPPPSSTSTTGSTLLGPLPTLPSVTIPKIPLAQSARPFSVLNFYHYVPGWLWGGRIR